MRMYETTLICTSNEQIILKSIKSSLENEIKNMGGIITIYNSNDKSCLCLAVPFKEKILIKNKIKRIIATQITIDKKYNYFKEHICVKTSDPVLKEAFYKALAVFDKETDIEIIKEELKWTNKLFIDSFYNFKMFELYDRWHDISLLVTENLNRLQLSGSFTELIKYLIKENNDTIAELYIRFNDSCAEIFTNDKGNLVRANSTDNSGKQELISYLITTAPKKIFLINSTDENKPLISTVKSLFENVVEFV
ncbi:MAG: sporulation protein YtxC [Clostridia bacterium]